MIVYPLPPLSPNQQTYIEYRVLVPQHTVGFKDGAQFVESTMVHPELSNPYYYDGKFH